MAFACNCPRGHHDGPIYRLCVGHDGKKTVYCQPITPGITTISCEAVPIVPDPRDARIASLVREVARLEALIVAWADCAPDVDRSLLDEADRIRSLA